MKIFNRLLCVGIIIFSSVAYADDLSSQNFGLFPQKMTKAERRKAAEIDDVKIPNAPKKHTINWSKELDLDEEQQQHLQKIYAENMQKKQKIAEQIAELHKQIKTIDDTEEQQIRSILNEKQKIKMDKVMRRINRHNPEKKGAIKPTRKKMRSYGHIGVSQ